MRTWLLPRLVVVGVMASVAVVCGNENPAPPNAQGTPVEVVPQAEAVPPVEAVPQAEVDARVAYEAAKAAATQAEAAIGPLQEESKKADVAYAEAKKVANAKRQQATRAKDLAGEPGVNELQKAEAAVPAAVTALDEATKAKPPLDTALAVAKEAALPLQTTYDAAEKAAREAEAVAKTAFDAANQLAAEAKNATAQATAKRRAADAAKAGLTQVQQIAQQSQTRANGMVQKLTEAEAAVTAQKDSPTADAAVQKQSQVTAQKKTADDIVISMNAKVATVAAAAEAAEQVAQEFAKVAQEKEQAAAQATARRKAAADSAAALAQAQAAEQAAQAPATAAAQALIAAATQTTAADEALANTKKQVVDATAASEAAEKSAQAAATTATQIGEDAAKTDAEKQQATAEAAALRTAADAAKTALANVQQAEQQAAAQAAAAAQNVTVVTAQKKVVDDALIAAQQQVAVTTAAHQAAQEAAKDLIPVDVAHSTAAADAAVKRKAANDAKAVLAPVQVTLDQARNQANAAAQTLTRAEARKKATEEELVALKAQIELAKTSHVGDEEAAVTAEAANVPLKAEAERTRAAHAEAVQAAFDTRGQADQARIVLYRLVASRKVATVMESPEPPKPAGRIDEIVFAKLQTLGIQPTLCSDAVFIRRAYLDLTGTLPSADEARTFILDSDPNKRIALIDRLLDQTSHIHYWAMKWCDVLRVKAEFPVKVWPNAAQAYHRWVWDSIARNKPYDQFARELLTSSGSNYRVGSVNFFRAIQDKTPADIAASVGLSLMSTRVDSWPEDRRTNMAAFFSQVGFKPTSEWKEEIVFWDPLNSTAVPGSIAPGIDNVAKSVTATNQIAQTLASPLSENGPLEVVFPDGTKTTISPNRDPREVFADWLIRPENPWFAKAIANRTWAWAMGRGIIHEPDDIRDDNPASLPELLTYLEQELVTNGYDMKHLKRQIFTSTTYQFSSIPKIKTPEAEASFASYQLRRIEAEVLIDALNNITGSSDLYTSAVPEPFTYIPKQMTAVALADGSVTSSFLTLFGRSSRSTGMETERVSELASPQWLHMLNSATLQDKLQNGPTLGAITGSNGKPNEIAEKLYLTILSRFPTVDDVQAAEEYASTGVTKGRDVWLDLAWALINSPEFLMRH